MPTNNYFVRSGKGIMSNDMHIRKNLRLLVDGKTKQMCAYRRTAMTIAAGCHRAILRDTGRIPFIQLVDLARDITETLEFDNVTEPL
jgi:hypothetical protein